MKKFAVHLHIYYPNQWHELQKYMRNLQGCEFDLYITLAGDAQKLISEIKLSYPQAMVWQVENRGYDIGPFIDFLHHINLDEYQYILKLHTKGEKSKNYTRLNGCRFNNALWGRVLWDSMLSKKERLQTNLNILDISAQVGMVGSKYCLTNSKQDYEKLLPAINHELQKLNISPVDELSFIAGSMFLVRAKCLKPLYAYHITDFALTDGDVKEGTLAHAIERIMGVLISTQGYSIRTIRHNGYGIYFMCVALKRFLFQQKITNSGKKLIKICKLPVYSRKCV